MEKKRFAFIVAACLISVFLSLACARSPAPSQTAEDRLNASAPTPKRAAEGIPPPLSTPAAAPVPNPIPVIVAFGDSLTAGVAGRSYPDDLQDLLDQHHYRYKVENQGVSGDTTTDGLARIDNVTAQHPVLVILEFGGNDGLRGVPVASIRENLESIIRQFRQAKVPLVLLGITLPPNYGADYVNPFTAMYPDLARRYNLRFIPFLLLHIYQHPELMQPDGVHPSGEGNRIVAQDVFKLIQPLLEQTGGKRIP